jgi:HAD superfamily hydrolase (TIGR01549 family)
MKINTILFDLDGVLIDSSIIWARIHQKTAKKLNLRVPSRKEITNLWGESWDFIIEALWPGINPQLFKETANEIKKRENILLKPIKDVMNVLKELKETGYNLGLVTAGSKESLRASLREAGIDTEFFKIIIADEDTKNHKPDPEPILLACNLLNVKTDNAIYVGDSLFDYRSAKSANVEFIAVLTGDVKEKEFKNQGVKNIISSVAELTKFLKSQLN